jgi:hypothetical protein
MGRGRSPLENPGSARRATLTQPMLLANLENSQWHEVTVAWNATAQTLTYWIDGQQGGTITGDLAQQYFAGSDYVHFGFTGATGASKNLQQVKVIGVDAIFEGTDGIGLASHGSIEGSTITGSPGSDSLIGGVGDDTFMGDLVATRWPAVRDEIFLRMATLLKVAIPSATLLCRMMA